MKVGLIVQLNFLSREKKDLYLAKVVLVGVIIISQSQDQSKEYLHELEFLTHTAGGDVIKRFTQKMEILKVTIALGNELNSSKYNVM